MPTYQKDISYIVEKEDAQAMIDRANSLRDKFIVAILYLTGARTTEILELRKKDIWVEGDSLFIKLRTAKLGRGKGFKVRERILEIPLEAPFTDIILKYVKLFENDEAILVNVNDSRIRQIVYELSDNRFCPYNFRHSRLTKLSRAGATVDELMYWKGGRTIKSVAPYLSAKPIGRRLRID